MKWIRRAFVLVAALAAGAAAAQPLTERYADIGTMIVTTSDHTMFPHEKRAQGHTYEGKAYPADVHYADRTVAIFVPKGFRAGDATDLVFYFHGWRNNVDDTLKQFKVAEQLAASGVNAVLVLAEGPKNAPDSFGGKLEETGVFKSLVDDVLGTLKARGLVGEHEARLDRPRRTQRRVPRHGVHPDARRADRERPEVYLFDALYGQSEKFAHWIDRFPGKLIDIYTAEGGTRDQSRDLMDDLRAWEIPFVAVPESAVTPDAPKKNRLVFIDSPLAHDDVVAKNEQFRAFLTASRAIPAAADGGARGRGRSGRGLLRARLLEHRLDLRALEDLREHERRRAALGADVRVGARLQERRDARGRAAALDRPQERGRPVLVLRLHVAVRGRERLEDLGARLAVRLAAAHRREEHRVRPVLRARRSATSRSGGTGARRRGSRPRSRAKTTSSS